MPDGVSPDMTSEIIGPAEPGEFKQRTHHPSIKPEGRFNPDIAERAGGTPPKKDINRMSFLELQAERHRLQRNPDPSQEDRVKDAVLKLYEDARDEGFFVGLKNQIENIQRRIGDPDTGGNITYEQAMKDIRSYDTSIAEENAKVSPGWNDDFKGMIQEYRDVALLAMNHAWVEAEANLDHDPVKRRTAQDLERQLEERKFGDIPELPYAIAENYIKSFSKKTGEHVSSAPADLKNMAKAVALGTSMARKEVEPSLDQSLALFHKAERLCEMYTPEDLQLIKNKVRATEDEAGIDLFEREVKVFHAALLKRRGANTMKAVGENSALKDISETDLVFLFKNMPGYLESMQEIADIVINRKNIPGLDFSFADIENQSQFLRAMDALDNSVLLTLHLSQDMSVEEAQFSAQKAVNTAINTMFAFNLFERYLSNWDEDGKVRHKSNERGGKGPAFYDRLIAKPIYDSMHPIDDIINEALKPDAKKPDKNNITKWVATQMTDQGFLRKEIKGLGDFDEIRVVDAFEDPDIYWRVENRRGQRILFVPSIRPTILGGSILDVNNINIKTTKTSRRFGIIPTKEEITEKKSFLKALAEKDEIDLDNTGLASNFCNNYTIGGGDYDTIKDAFRDKKTLKDWPEIIKALGSFELGENMEFIAWLYVDLTDAIDPKKRIPTLFKSTVEATRIDRWQLDLQKRNDFSKSFNLLGFIRNWKNENR